MHTFLTPFRDKNTAEVVKAAYAFMYTLDATQLAETVYPYTLSVAERWSNLPGATRNGPTLGPASTTTSSSTGTIGTAPAGGTPPGAAGGTGGPGGGGGAAVSLPTFVMSDTQRAAALALVKAALSDDGYATMQKIRAGDDVIASTSSSLQGWGSELYHVAILGTPSPTAVWMLQISGHHLTYTITYNGAKVSGTPMFIGTEPPNFSVLSDGTTVVSGTVGGSTEYFVNGQLTTTAPTGTVASTVAPIEKQRSAVYALLQLIQADPAATAAAKLSQSFDDVTMGVSSSSNDTNYPFNSAVETAQLYPTGTINRGVLFTALNQREQLSVIAAIAAWVNTQKIDIAAELLGSYIDPAALAQTYVAYSPGQGGTADFSPNPNAAPSPGSAQGSYVRIDGPRVWIEAVVQQAVAYRNENWVHYHTLWRDKTADYGACFSTGADAPAC